MKTVNQKAYHKTYSPKWRAKNREKCREISRAYRLKTKKCFPWKRHYYYARARCFDKNSYYYYKKGIKFLMTMEDFKILWFRDKAYLLKKPSIDRINSKGNYTLKNCRFIEMILNITLGIKEYWSKNRTWSRMFDKCVLCGTIKKKHGGYGFCISCYNKQNWHFYKEKRNYERRENYRIRKAS